MLPPVNAPFHPKANSRYLSYKTMSEIGYDIDDVEKIREYRPETLEEFRNFPTEMIVSKCLTTSTISFSNHVSYTMTKGKEYVTDLMTFIDIFNGTKKFIEPTDKFIKNFRKYSGEDLSGKRALCWLYGGGIGDVLFIGPIIKFLKEKYPTCYFTLAIPEPIHPMVKCWDFVDEVIPVPYPAYHFFNADYHISFDSVIVKCREAENENIYRLLSRWIYQDISDEKLIPIINPDIEKVNKFKQILSNIDIQENNFAVVQLEANTVVRSVRDETKIKILNELIRRNITPIIIDHPKKNEQTNQMISQCNGTVYNLSKYSESIDDAIGLMSLSKMVISVDTGAIHIAAALGKPLFGIFGPFTGKIRLATYPNAHWIDAQCHCAPCYRHGFAPCRSAVDSYPICYDQLDIQDLGNKIEEVWKGLQ